ncbi:RNA methyltransferase [Roseomonas sp. ACRSG]|nr:RNA methyltransferase [Roseomonas sp. ACRSG]
MSRKRGFAAIGLVAPKCNANVGGVLRAASCYDADLIVLSGSRYKRQSTDTMKAYRHIPLIHNQADVFDAAPFDAVPVAVDLVEGAVPLPSFAHPERAFYIFGPEDGTLGEKTLSRCAVRLAVPTRYCMNLAATVKVILYDRMAKSALEAKVKGEVG